MAAERYVLLGVARARADWFRRVGQWATSAVIAVLIMAIIGAGMWLAFNDSWTSVKGEVDSRTDCIVENKDDC